MPWLKWKRNPYRPVSVRQRLWLVVLTLCTVLVVCIGVLDVPARLQRMNRPPPDAPPCSAKLQTGCVGGKLEVVLVRPAVPAAAPARPASR